MQMLSIIIPVKNEAKNVVKLVKTIHESLTTSKILYELIFVDDHSNDDTKKNIQLLSKTYPIQLFDKQGKAGKAYSILEGSTYAKSDIICMLDADLQYDPKHISSMMKMITSNPDIGVVIAERKTHNGNFVRKIGSRLNTFFVGRLLMGLNVDIQSGLKLFRKDIVKHIDESFVGPWSLDVALLHTAKEIGYTFGTVPITFEIRESETSKINFASTAWEILTKAVHTKVKSHKKVYRVDPHNGDSMEGAGFIHKKQTFVTHSTLHHDHSAILTLKPWQKVFTIGLIGILIFSASVNLQNTLIALMAVLTTIYFLDVLFNFYMVMKSLHYNYEISIDEAEIRKLKDADLPIYSILCPLYKEAHMIPQFVKGISQLEWPKNKLDVMLLLEEDDTHTIETAAKMDLPAYVRVVVVPDSNPKTKPKATNYGLARAKGEYVVIYDAEDIPDPLQLKKAFIGFKISGPKVACLQAKLNYYNPNHNFLTRLFTAEYSLWFDVILPGLQALSTTIPLGGTSNHFRAKDLIEIEGWDPFNVTEDCDLGARLFKKGYTTAIIDSTTLEEATSNVKNWIRQRSRWIKGYIQTYFIHMRQPVKFARDHGFHSVLFNVIIGGKIAFLFINPILWFTTIAYFTLYAYVGPQIESMFPTVVFYMAAGSLIFGNFLYIYYYMIGSAKRSHWSLMKFIFFVPLYWLLVSIAALMALFQLIFKPHYWEKTTHGFHLDPDLLPSEAKVALPKAMKKPKKVTQKSWKDILASDKLGSLLLIAGAFIGYGINFINNLYLGKVLNVEEFSLVSLMSSFFFLAAIILGPLSNTITHQAAYTKGQFGKIALKFWLNIRKVGLFGSIAITGLWILCINYMSLFFQTTTLLPFIIFTPVWIIVALVSIDRGFILGNQLFGLVGGVIIFEALAKLLLSIGFVYYGFNSYVYASMPISLLLTCIILIITNKHFLATHRDVDETHTQFPKSFFLTSFVTGAATLAFLSIDLILAKHYLSVADAGHYALLALVGKVIFFTGTVFSQFITPVISRLAGEKKRTTYTFYLIFVGILFASLAAYGVLAVLSPYTLPLLFGDKAAAIIPFVLEYGMALLLLTLGSAFVIYHQARKEYLHSLISLLIVPAQILGVYFMHQSLANFIHVMFVICAVYFLSVLLLHFFYDLILDLISNLRDLTGLFVPQKYANKQKSNYRILIFNWRDTRHSWSGGAEVYIQNIAKELIRQGHKVTLFCGNDRKSPRNQVIDGVQIIRRGGFYTVYIWACLYYTFRLHKYFDIVIDSQNGVPFFTPLYVRVPKISIIHHVHQEVFSEHLSFPMAKLAQFIEGKLMPLVYGNTPLVTVSKSSSNEMIKHRMGKKDNISIISPGIHADQFRLVSKTKYPSFIYIGRLKEYKNLDVIIKAFAKVLTKYPEAQLTIAGTGEYHDKLVNLAAQLGAEKQISFPKRISEKEKGKFFGRSWAALQPSMIEGFGITVIEANAAGTPVIASRVNGLKDSVIDGETGLLCTPRSVEEFYTHMLSIIENQKLRQDLSHQAFLWSKKFTWAEGGKQFLHVINESIENNNRSTEQKSNFASISMSKIA